MSTKNRPELPVGLLLLFVILLSSNLRAPLAALGPVVGIIQQDLNAGNHFMGWVAAIPMLAFSLFSLPSARLSQRFGIEKVLTWAIVLMTAGLALRSALPSAPLLMAGTLVLSAAIAAANVLLPALAKRNLPNRVGLIVGTLSVTMALSSSLAAATAIPLVGYGGWRLPLGIWLPVCAAALLLWLPLKNRLNTACEPAAETPSDGLQVWRLRPAWCISLFMGLQSMLFYALVNFLPLILQEKGWPQAAASEAMVLFQFGSLSGSLAVSACFARVRHKRLLTLAAAAMMPAGAAGLWLGQPDGVGLWIFLSGAGSSGCFSAALILFALRTDNSRDAAALSGMAQTVGYAVAMAGPAGMGILADRLGSWSASLPILSGLMLVGCILAWFAAAPEIIRPEGRCVS
ncbi:MAG: MFS transporter [Neisseria sp.]|nr:MFS transporter [Neisseria sp.]